MIDYVPSAFAAGIRLAIREGNERRRLAHSWNVRQLVIVEVLVFLNVGHRDLQHEVVLAGDMIDLLYHRQSRDRRFERANAVPAMALQGNQDEHDEAFA